MKDFLKASFNEKINDYYRALPSLGKIYIDEAFKKVALPLNTTATGTGLDVLPTGSRLPITDDYIRTFTYWKDIYDIDTSVTFIKDDHQEDVLYWGNYHTSWFGNSALTSGDDRSANGSEYIDFRISELLQKGYKYAVYTLNAYRSNLNEGEIFTGYQNKSNLDTVTWSSKNIAMKIQVKGESTAFMAFAIDLATKEIIVLNQMLESGSRVVQKSDMESIADLLDSRYLNTFNVYKIASLRGEVVEDISKADIVFAKNTLKLEGNQKLITMHDVDELVKLLK